MKKILNSKKNFILMMIIILVIIALSISTPVIIKRIAELRNKEEIPEMTYKTYKMSGNTGKKAWVLVTFNNEIGIKEVHQPKEEGKEEFIIDAKGKTKIAVDYEMEDLNSYNFSIVLKDGTKKEYTIDYELPRVKGNYTLIGSTYSNEPDLTGLVKEKTRYLYLENVTADVTDDEGNPTTETKNVLIPGNWITDEKPINWYNYEEQKWANIYIENNGVASYYVWIPRYCYKVDTVKSTSGNERMDVKFINTYNQYIDVDGNVTEWGELEAQGYKIPEAFTWIYDDTEAIQILDGYWETKYQLSTLNTYKINYNLVANIDEFAVSNFTNNVETTAKTYTYAINGEIVKTSETLEEYQFKNSKPNQTNTINITALDDYGRILGSMTKQLELTDVNPPDLTGLDPYTTFYVYWDENKNEHNEIPIANEPPENWYNYTYSRWANIVTRNNGEETYFVWIPRYQYRLDTTAQRSEIKFIMGTSTKTDVGYQIPEAFTWKNDEGEVIQITGYWETKYQLNTGSYTTKLDATMTAKKNTIEITNITGTTIEEAVENSINLTIEYYIDGNRVHTGTEITENYIYNNLEYEKEYAINIIFRNTDTNKYLGAVTKKITIEKEIEQDDVE